jgi:hypothetical protein
VPKQSLSETALRFLGRSHTLRTVRAYAKQTPASAAVKSAVMQMTREGDDAVLRGYAYFTGLPADGIVTSRNRVLWARHEDSRHLVRLRTKPAESDEAAATSRDPQWNYAKAGFDARLPLKLLRDETGGWRYGSWVVAIGAVTPRGVARGGLRLGPDAYRADLTPISLDDDAWLVPTVTNGVIGFRLEPADLTLVTCHLQDGKLTLTGRLAGELPSDAVATLGRIQGISELSMPVEPLPDSRGHHMVRVSIDLAEVVDAVAPIGAVPIGGAPDRLIVGLRTHPGDLTPHPFACDPNFASFSTTVSGHRIAVQVSDAGWLALTVRRDGPTVDSVSWNESGELCLAGSGADLVQQMKLVGGTAATSSSACCRSRCTRTAPGRAASIRSGWPRSAAPRRCGPATGSWCCGRRDRTAPLWTVTCPTHRRSSRAPAISGSRTARSTRSSAWAWTRWPCASSRGCARTSAARTTAAGCARTTTPPSARTSRCGTWWPTTASTASSTRTHRARCTRSCWPGAPSWTTSG